MAHVTFVHGIGNKPAADKLSKEWRGTLAENDLDLDTRGVTTEFVYWADLLYPKPVVKPRYESTAGADLAEVPEIGLAWSLCSGAEADFLRSVSAEIGLTELASDAAEIDVPGIDTPDGVEERVWLPWFIKRRLMRIFLRDVHHYLFNAEHSPRSGETYRLREEIRSRTLGALTRGAERPGPHIVAAHSLGTVIAYDCLKSLGDCPGVDGLITFGSPLGIDEIQDRLKPEWSRANGFPTRVGRWVNVYDRLDVVCGLDPELRNDFSRDGECVIDDLLQPNTGTWRHSATKYLAGIGVRKAIEGMLS